MLPIKDGRRQPVRPGLLVWLIPAIGLLVCCKPDTRSNSIATDAATIAAGRELFDLNCSACHNFSQDAIGPQLSGLTTAMPVDWIKKFIKDPQAVINSGDQQAKDVAGKFKAGMPPFAGLKDQDLDKIIAFIHTHKNAARSKTGQNGTALTNPLPEIIRYAGQSAALHLISQFPATTHDTSAPRARITQISFEPGSGLLFVVDLRGKLYRVESNSVGVYLDIKKERPAFVDEPGLATGFGSFAFSPEFRKNGLLYTTHTENASAARADFFYGDSIKVTLQWVLTEWKASDPESPVFAGTSRELMRINMVSGIHGMQQIAFNPRCRRGDADYGLLYIGVGDGGAVENGFPFLAHDKEKVWGTILRIDPRGHNSSNGRYGLPKNNPFVHDNNPHALKEIFAYGFRNPHRFCWDKTGAMIGCNIGQSHIESIYLLKAGGDYGWPVREGNFVVHPYDDLSKIYPLSPNDSIYHISYPVAEYDHDEGQAICGGFDYEGKLMPAFDGKFIFGDIPTGRLFYCNMSDLRRGKNVVIQEWRVAVNGRVQSLRQVCGNRRVDLHFGQDAHDELYILTKADGKLYKLSGAAEQ